MGLILKRFDRFQISEKGSSRIYSCAKVIADGKYLFLDEASGRPRRIDGDELQGMIVDLNAKRLVPSDWIARVSPFALMDPDAPGLSATERAKVEAAQKKVNDAATKLFYVTAYDKGDNQSKTTHALKSLIDKAYPSAFQLGLIWKPSPSAIRQAIAKGAPGDRNLIQYLSERGTNKGSRWCVWVQDAQERLLNEYYSPQPLSMKDAITLFIGEAIEENHRRRELRKQRELDGDPLSEEEAEFDYPKPTAIRDFIHRNETEDRLALREGALAARRRYQGRKKGEEAIGPLDIVQVDQTQIDTFLNIYNEDGEVVGQKRPYLVSVIDHFSRMILALYLSYEAPSSYTVMEGIKQMLKRKDFLIERYGHDYGSTDGHGVPNSLLFDNGVENVGVSMRVLLSSSGISLALAPRATPEAKAQVERSFKTYNSGIWHVSPGGIPMKPHQMSARRLDARELAEWSLKVATDVMWDWIIKEYHVRATETLGGSPAQIWSGGKADPLQGRDTFVDMEVLDTICGQTARGLLTASGLRFENQRFHDAGQTTRLLADLLPSAPRSRQRKTGLQTGTVEVTFILYPKNCSKIAILNTVTQKHVVLPNLRPKFSEGLSWADAAAILKDGKAAAQNFISDEELYLRRLAHLRLRKQHSPDNEAKPRGSKPDPKPVAPDVEYTLVNGQVTHARVVPTVTGTSSEVPREMAFSQVAEPQIVHKDQVRGKRKKGTAAASKRTMAEAQPSVDPALTPEPVETPMAKRETAGWRTELANDPNAFFQSIIRGEK